MTACVEITEENLVLDFHVDLLVHQRRPRPGEFWAENGTGATQVNFCPFCGTRATVSRED